MNASLILRILGILLFAAGILSSALLTGGLTWAELEAAVYGFPHYTSERFDGLSCPPLMMRGETSIVRVTVHNPSDRVITPIIRVDLSAPGLFESSKTQVTVDPGGSEQLAWAVSDANIDLRYFIFAKVNRSPSYPLPTAEAICGTLVLDIPFLNGMQLLILWLALCLVCIPLGLGVWRWGLGRAHRTPGIATALTIVSLSGLIAALNGVWILGGLFFVGIVLLALGLLRR